jgi:hypothetical protein
VEELKVQGGKLKVKNRGIKVTLFNGKPQATERVVKTPTPAACR